MTRQQVQAVRHSTTERLAKRLHADKSFGSLRRCRTEAKQMLQGRLVTMTTHDAIQRGHLIDNLTPRQKWHEAHKPQIFDRRSFVPKFVYQPIIEKCNRDKQSGFKNLLRSVISRRVSK